jgi:LPS sulfotransferase NodH
VRTLLCDLLAATKVLGVPHEYLNIPKHGRQLIERLCRNAPEPASREAYFEVIQRHRTSANGVFGLKAHINQCLVFFQEGFLTGYFGELQYIHIRRRDTLGQAISMSIATQTDSWTSHEKSTTTPQYSDERLRADISTILYHDYLWEQFFTVNQINPCTVFYEDLLEQPNAEVGRVANFLGVAEVPAVELASTGLARQASGVNDEWRQRFNHGLRIGGASSS